MLKFVFLSFFTNKNNKIYKVICCSLFFLFISLLLNGCFMAPGMTMKSPASSSRAAGPYIPLKPHFIPIDVALVRALNRLERVNQEDTYYYHIGVNDVLSIYVWGHPELNAPVGQTVVETGVNSALRPSMSPTGYLVDPDGDIYFPMAGTIHVAGKTVQQIRIEVSEKLAKYIRKPQLDVRVAGFRSKKVYVMGEVVHPGLQPLTDAPMSIMDAINLAGGLEAKTADPSHIFVIRGDYAKPVVYWLDAKSPDSLLLAENFRLLSFDVIFVSTAEVARWNRAIEQILPTIQTAWFTYSLIHNN